MKCSGGLTFERLDASPLGAVVRFLDLNSMKMSFTGTYGFSSSRRVSAMFSNTASIFAITSAFADAREDAIAVSTLRINNQVMGT